MANEVQSFGYKDNAFNHQVNAGKGSPKPTHPSAWLEVGPDTDDSTRGMLPPRGDKSDVVNPANGLIIFDVPTDKYWYYSEAQNAWVVIGGDADLSAYYTALQVDALLAKKVDQQDGLVTGGVVTHISGLTFNVSAATYVIGGVKYTSPGGQITLDAADATNPRVDLIAVDTAGAVVKITGTPDPNPAEPQTDPTTQWALTSVQVAAGATEPTGIANLLVFDENSEWAVTTTGTIAANPNSIAQPFTGTKTMAVTSYANGAAILFTTGTPVDVASVNTFLFWLRLSAQWANNQGITVQFYRNGVAASNVVTAPVQKTVINQWQNVALNVGSFTWSQTSFDRVCIKFSGSTSTVFYMDAVKLQSGITGTGGGITQETDPVWQSEKANYYTKTQADGRYLQSETDPVWNAQKANYQTTAQADAKYLQSETDPVWNAQKGNYYTKTEADAQFLESETDPVFTANGVPKTRTITINGDTKDLSSDRTFTVAAGAPYATASGTDTYTAAATPALTAYTAGSPVLVKFTNANTGASTINIDGLGAKAITKSGSTALAAGDIKAGEIKQLVYDGTGFQIVGGGGSNTQSTTSFVGNVNQTIL